MKNESLVHQSYIPKAVFGAFADLIGGMQGHLNYWAEMAKLLFAGEYEKIDYKKGEEDVEAILMLLAFAQLKVQERLQELSSGD